MCFSGSIGLNRDTYRVKRWLCVGSGSVETASLNVSGNFLHTLHPLSLPSDHSNGGRTRLGISRFTFNVPNLNPVNLHQPPFSSSLIAFVILYERKSCIISQCCASYLSFLTSPFHVSKENQSDCAKFCRPN